MCNFIHGLVLTLSLHFQIDLLSLHDPASFIPVHSWYFFTNYYTTCSAFLLSFDWEFQGDNLKGEQKSDEKRNVYTYLHEIPRQDTCTELDFLNMYLFFQGKWNAFHLPRAEFGPSGVCVAPPIIGNVTNTYSSVRYAALTLLFMYAWFQQPWKNRELSNLELCIPRR